ncbi:MAG: hypothetical protein GC168_17030 [Candidatus Hydrogenedens sp.]|nr:hypothetical protein [Candidatus Hydrogenedens sp.]
MNFKRILGTIVAALLAVIIVGAVMKERADAHYFDDYDPNLDAGLQVRSVTEQDGYVLEDFTFQARPGEQVPTLLARPADSAGKLPLILFLHGIGQKKEFLKDICKPFVQNGFAFACFDQYMQGERKLPKESSALAQVNAFLDRPWKTVNDSRRFLDYVALRGDIDPERIYVVGASYGAITGSTFAARDPRVRAIALVYGGGDINKMLQAPMIEQEVANNYPQLGPWMPLLRNTLAYLLDAADPVHYAAGISPRPVLLQNGKEDLVIGTPGAEALQAAVQEPKTIQWYEGDHIGLDVDTVKVVLLAGMKWIVEQDAEFRGGDTSLAQDSLAFFNADEAPASEGA